MNVSTRVSNLRKDCDLTQKELSDKIGMNQSVLNRIEKGTRPLRDDELVAIADFFNVSADYLLGRRSASSDSLSNEQKKLLKGFEELNSGGKKVILDMITQLNFAHDVSTKETNEYIVVTGKPVITVSP